MVAEGLGCGAIRCVIPAAVDVAANGRSYRGQQFVARWGALLQECLYAFAEGKG